MPPHQVPNGAVPALVEDFSGLAPAFIGVGSIDPLAPENVQYAQRLMLAGNHVELHVVPGAYHAFSGFASYASISRQYAEAVNDAIRRAFTESWSVRARRYGAADPLELGAERGIG